MLKEREMYWIEYYDTFKHGLNATMGGEGNKIADAQQIRELWDQGHCVRDICLLLDTWPKTVLNNLDVPLEECQKRGPIYKTCNSMKHFGDYQTGRALPVSCFDMETGEHVMTFPSYYKAAKYIGAKNSSVIIKAATGMLKSAYGYFWRTGDDRTKLSLKTIEENKTRATPIRKYVVCVETNQMYTDTVCAQKFTGINYRSITFACQGRQKIAGGFHWRYATDEDKRTLNLNACKKEKRKPYNCTPVRCVETGVVYQSMEQAAIETGASRLCIGKCCRNLLKTSGKLHWEYAIEQHEHLNE